jgi:hypothetical protein
MFVTSISMRIRLLLIVAVLAVAGAAHPSYGQGVKPPANDDCLACHGDSSAVREDGRSVAVLPDVFGASVHGAAGVACVDCHADLATVTEFPHPEKLAAANCVTCHEAVVAQYRAGAHAQAIAGGSTQAATCVSCHGMHDIRAASDPASRTHHLNVASTCGACHGPRGARTGAPNVASHFDDSIHGRALRRQGLVVAPNCASCHGPHDIRKKTDPASTVNRAHVVGTCTKCHEGIRPAYERSVHAQAVKAGNALAPVCADCHTAHDIGSVETDAWKLGIIRECGTCHEQSLRTYRDTFHGKITELGFTRVAKCADCHGAHDILPASNPASMISPARRLSTCRQCHATANENFARYDPHADPHDRARNPVLYYTSVFMKLLLGGVFLFFGIHTLLWFPRSLQVRREHARRREAAAGPEPPDRPSAREEA